MAKTTGATQSRNVTILVNSREKVLSLRAQIRALEESIRNTSTFGHDHAQHRAIANLGKALDDLGEAVAEINYALKTERMDPAPAGGHCTRCLRLVSTCEGGDECVKFASLYS